MLHKIYSFFTVLLILIATVSCNTDATNKFKKSKYRIHGTLNNINSNTAYLHNSTNHLIDSVKIKNNQFTLKGSVDSLELVHITFNNDSIKMVALLENSNFELYASPYKQLIFGGKAQQAYNSYLEKLDLLETRKVLLLQGFTKNPNQKTSKLLSDFETIENSNFDFKLNSLDATSIAPVQSLITSNLLLNSDLSKDELLKIKAIIAKNSNNNEQLAMIDSRIEAINTLALEKEKKALEAASKKEIKRQLAPMFGGESLSGNTLELSSILKGKKVVLVDFWASWCGPCRIVTPQIRALYKAYKNKGFDVVTISEDKTRDAWRNGLAEDQILDWNHIYDDNMRIAYMFNVSSIPHMVLLDGNGGIISNKISMNSLLRELKIHCK